MATVRFRLIVSLTLGIATLFLAPQIQVARGQSLQSISPTFAPAVAYGSGGYYSTAVAIGDVNGDGLPDLLAINYCGDSSSCESGAPSTLGILLGNGNGTFQTAVTHNAGGPLAYSLAVADLNGDGKLDVVVTHFWGNMVSVLLGLGNGNFQAAVDYDTGGWFGRSVAIADVNHDGMPDLIVADAMSCASILLGNGDGSFQPASTFSSGLPVEQVAVADLDRDGNPDIVLANDPCGDYGNCSTEGSVAVLLGNGDGNFQPAATYASGGLRSRSVVVGDLNRDGFLDVAVGNADGTIGVLLGQAGGQLQPATVYSTGGIDFLYATAIALADFNRDGSFDLALTNFYSATVTVLQGKPLGTFLTAVPFNSAGIYPGSVAVADVNRDGKLDMVVANGYASSTGGPGTIGVLLNSTPLCTTPPETTASAIPNVLWPANGKMVRVKVAGRVTGSANGCSITSAAFTVTDEYGRVKPSGPVTLSRDGTYSFEVWLEASRLGADIDGRFYIVTVSALNDAGLRGSSAVRVIVPHDRGR